MHISYKRNKKDTDYYLDNQKLENVELEKYLGIYIYEIILNGPIM